jgi:hypothetical protein
MRTALRIGSFVCFLLLLMTVLALASWLCFAYLASGSPIPALLSYRTAILLAMVVSLCTYFKWPLVAVAVGWLDLLMVLLGVFPWEEKSATSFFYQFMFDLTFFGAAHIGLFLQQVSTRIVEKEMPVHLHGDPQE